MFTLYHADFIGNPSNCSYPHKVKVTDSTALTAAVSHDYVCAQYKNNYRNGDNFLGADCLPVDCDNDHSENPEDWVLPADVMEAFPGVTFAVHYSRFNMREKNGKPARPKFHILFPIEYMTDAAAYSDMKKLVNSIFPYFDTQALDAARFFFGTSSPEVEIYSGDRNLTEFLENDDFDADMPNDHHAGQGIPEGSRNATMSRFAGRVIKKYGDSEEAFNCYMEEAAKCTPPLEDSELMTIWHSAQKFYARVQQQDGYVPPEVYNDDISYKPADFSDVGQAEVLAKHFSGELRYVLALSEIDDTEQAYRLTFGDGSSIIAGARHLWNVQVINNGRKEKQLQTQQMYEAFSAYRERHKDDPFRSIYKIPVAGALELPDAELPVTPYLYGYWLGNGCATKPEITIRTCDVAGVLKRVPYKVSSLWHNVGDSVVVRIPHLRNILLKTYHDKHIPKKYLRASEHQRWELLQGLMDSDGCIGNIKAQSTYVSTEKQLALDVRELLWSLGIKNAMTVGPSLRYGEPTGMTLYTIRFTSFADLPTSGLARKLWRRKDASVSPTRSNFHYIHSIEPVRERIPMRCIQVSSPSHQYLAGPSMVPTHNSELAAAIALLLTCGDGEERAEVYGCAADRQQASIVFEVAADMVRMCPALSRRVKILTSSKRIIYLPTNSFYQVLSAEAYSKHGFNIHGVVFDELHTQPNRKLFDVMTKGSGDARMQPLYFLITTAGTDTQSICYETHQKALDILDGRKHDPTFYPVIYGAAQDEDWTDPKVWKKANPSLGITVGIDKVKAACESAKQNPAEENSFRQLRLNQWVKQAVRWMPMDKWDKCAFPVDSKALEGRVCYGGLDLSSSTDITAFVLVFPPEDEDDKYTVMPFFWIPEDNLDLRVRRDHVNYDLWEKQGFLKTTEGNVVHYGFIEAFIEELGTKYNIREIAFDRWGAVQMVQNLENLGFTVVPFGQGFKDMSPPTKELMKLTLEQKIAHGGHPVLRWMMDNIFIRTDPAGNIKPDKEKSTEKIDGAVAMIMALDRAIRYGGNSCESVYDERGLLIL